MRGVGRIATSSRNGVKLFDILTWSFFQHPSSVSTLRADPPSPTRGEGVADATRRTARSCACRT
ncbi:MAG: hypothetical protein E5X52_14210 [Mesorhizobium sp.]|nr:MAG: hypothetical protein E5X52_14210 [Mesorhizobium sp.]